MSNTENLPDEHFREKLENLEISPSDKVWSGISSHLERTAMTQRKNRVAWLWQLSAITLVVSLSAAAYVIYDDHNSETAETTKRVAQNIAAPTVPAEKEAITGNSSSTSSTSAKGEGRTGAASSQQQKITGASSASSSHAASSSVTVTGSGTNSSLGSNSNHNSSISAANATASSQMNVSNTSGSGVNEGPKVSAEPEDLFNEGSKLSMTAVRHAEPAAEPFVPEQEDIKPDPYATAKVLAPGSFSPIASRMLSVKPRGIESELEEVQYEEIPEGETCPHWVAGVNYTYGQTYRKLKDNDPEEFNMYPYYFIDPNKQNKSYFDSVESKGTGYVQALSLGYRAGRFTLKSGIEQSKFEWHTKMATGFLDTSTPEQTFVISTATTFYSNDTLGSNYAQEIMYNQMIPSAPPQYEDTVEMTHTFRHISIPLTLSYSFTKPCSKFGVSITGGMAASFLNSYTLTQDGSRQQPAENNISKQSYQLIAGASISYAPVRWLSFELQPTYRRFVQPVNKKQSVNTYPYMLGGQAGVYFRF